MSLTATLTTHESLCEGRVALPLSINTYGGTEIPVFLKCVAGMIERTVQIISIIKK